MARARPPGIGQTTALLLAERGAAVLIVDRDIERAGHTMGELEDRGGVAVSRSWATSPSRPTAQPWSRWQWKPSVASTSSSTTPR